MSMIGAIVEGPLAWGLAICTALIAAGIVCGVWRLVIGETLPDRVVALDLLSMLLTALLVIFAVAVRSPAYLDAALALSLVSFLATVAFARYVERRAHLDAPPPPAPEPAAEDAAPDKEPTEPHHA